MHNCRDLEPMLAAYVDGEAPPAERASVDAHLERCPPCRTRVENERAVHQAVCSCRDRLRACASESLKARCAAHRPSTRRAGLRSPRVWVPLSLAATLVLAVSGIFLFGTGVEALAAQLTIDHVKCFKLPPSSPSADAATVALDWKTSQGWEIGVPSSSDAEQLQLMCVRRCFVTDGRAAHMMYKWRGEPLSVYVLPAAEATSGPGAEAVTRFGHEAVIWSNAGRTYVVLARGRPDDAVLQYVRANVR